MPRRPTFLQLPTTPLSFSEMSSSSSSSSSSSFTLRRSSRLAASAGAGAGAGAASVSQRLRRSPRLAAQRMVTRASAGTSDRHILKYIMENVYALRSADADNAAELLDELLDDVRAISDSAPHNDNLRDALRLFYAAHANAERLWEETDTLSDSGAARLHRTMCLQAFSGYQLLANNVRVE